MEHCKNCNEKIINPSLYCEICEFPIGAGEKEQSKFLADQILKKSDVEESIVKLKKGRQILIAIGIYNIVIPLLPMFKGLPIDQIIISMIIGIISIVFGLLTFKVPKLALLIPLITICAYYIFLIFFDFQLFFRGLIWKALIVSVLVYAFWGVYKSDKILKENAYLATKLGFNKIQNK